ncbi:MAG: YtfJ family protein [Candidatus Marinimicrobia bacterium]|nr:YtfJ family protein [Candidatus Neomarinimicrobiota bacterium]
MKKLILILVVLFLITNVFAELPLGAKPKVLNMSGKVGGRTDGTAWSSNELVGKVWVVFYADPDESDLNDPAADEIKAKDYPKDKQGSVAIVNMAATWKPNFAISMILKKKQEKFPSTIYVKDFKKLVVKKWNLKDDSNDIVVFDKDGKVVFSKDGKLSKKDITLLLKTIDENL